MEKVAAWFLACKWEAAAKRTLAFFSGGQKRRAARAVYHIRAARLLLDARWRSGRAAGRPPMGTQTCLAHLRRDLEDLGALYRREKILSKRLATAFLLEAAEKTRAALEKECLYDCNF